MKKKTKVFVAIPTTGTIVDSQSYILRDIQDLYSEHVELVYPTQCVRRIFHDFARNKMVEEFLESDCDIMWFLDSDITPPVHVMDLVALYQDKWQVAGSVYPVFMNPPGEDHPEVVITCYRKNIDSGSLSLAAVDKSGVDFVDGLATGCLFIKREVFGLLNKPYFEFKFNREDRDLKEGEDLGFCKKLSELGIKFFTDFDLICKHQKTIDLLDVNNYAIHYSNRRVLSYDQSIRTELEAAIQQAFTRGYRAGQPDLTKASPIAKPKSSVLWTP